LQLKTFSLENIVIITGGYDGCELRLNGHALSGTCSSVPETASAKHLGKTFVVSVRTSSRRPFLDLVDQTACDSIPPRGTIMPKCLESPPEQGMFNNNVDLAMRVYERLPA
jgi:hypothetical protein